MYLLDTNVILELLLNQEQADVVEQLLQSVSPERLFFSECSLYSPGIVLVHRKLYDVFVRAVDDLLVTGSARLMRLTASDMQDVVQTGRQFNLDFDDAYQYAVAQRYDLTIVSFDKDFDRTQRGRKTPVEIMAELTS